MASKTWFITGTSTGFGRALTEALLARGDRVAATLRRPAALDDLAAGYGRLLWRAELDVSRSAQVRRVVDDAFAALGRIDVVVSNAGYSLVGAAEEPTDEQVERQLDTNVLGSMTLARAALPHLRRQGGGHLIQSAGVLHHRHDGMRPMTAIDYFRQTGTVHIATALRDGREVVTPIWAVVVDGVPYIRSGYGPQSKWHRRVQRTGRAAFIDGPHRYPVTIENLDDETVNRKVDEAYRAKYADQGAALRLVVSPQVRASTMRVTLQ